MEAALPVLVQVPAEEIEGIAGAERHETRHIVRLFSEHETVFILHSAVCKERIPNNLVDCPFSVALDKHGVDPEQWPVDEPAFAVIDGGRLVPWRMAWTSP